MRRELELELYNRYPKIFAQHNLPMTETCMCWGFEHGDGWYPILDIMCRQLQWDTDKNQMPQVIATQVKEKFGTLNFYYNGGDPRGAGIVIMAEAMSLHICELCGMPGKLRKGGWLAVRCDTCNT